MDKRAITPEDIERVLKKYSDMVLRIAYTRTNNLYDAEDILQDVFIKYMERKVVFTDEEHEKAWFIRAAAHRAYSLLNSSWFKKTTAYGKDYAVTVKEKSEVYYAVAELPANMRTVIYLFYYEDMKITEIAAALGRTQSYVKSVLVRARKKLKQKLEVYNDV